MSDSPAAALRYLAFAALVLISGIAAVVGLVVVVNPYGLYTVVAPTRFTAVKPALTRYHEQIKQARVEQLKPELVILGNSRAEIGLDPKAAAVRKVAASGYNLAIPGMGTDVSLRQLQGMQRAHIDPKTVILGVDFTDFVPNVAARTAGAAPAPAAAPTAPAHWQFDTLFSLASVKDAVQTLRIQHDGEAATVDLDGFNPLLEYRGFVRADGYGRIFAQRAQENARALRRKSHDGLSRADMDRLQRMLGTAAQMNADIKLVIYPYHAHFLAMYEAAGLWPLFDEWKQFLVQAAERARQAHPGARITILDFSGFGTYSCAAVPDPADMQAVAPWYWEAGSFKKELGDIVLARIMTASASASAQPFGVALTAATLTDNAQRIAAERRACAASQPALFASAHQLIAAAPPP